jgi:hypothetical protein
MILAMAASTQPLVIQQPRKRGGQSTFNWPVANAILDRLSAGESLRQICRDDGQPNESTVRGWVRDDSGLGFATQYARARDLGYDAMGEELLEIADTARAPDASGKVDPGAVQAARLAVDARKWIMSKARPKKYGDHIDVTTGGEPINAMSEAQVDNGLLALVCSVGLGAVNDGVTVDGGEPVEVER